MPPNSKKREDQLAKQRLCQRRRYAEIKNDPQLLALEKEKRRQKYLKKKSESDTSKKNPHTIRGQRKKWRENSKRYRLRKKGGDKNQPTFEAVQIEAVASEEQLDSCEIIDEDESYTSQPNPLAEKNNPDPGTTPEFEDEERKSPIPRKRTVRDLSRSVVMDVAETINTRMPTEIETEFDIFGKSVAAHLKSLPIHKAIEAQMFIQNYLCNLRLEEMGHGTSNYAYSPSPNLKYQYSPSPINTLPQRHSPYTQPQEGSP